MLVQLNIRGIVLIDRLDLTFGAGLTVLTGETGAGKSILLDSLALALGGRGDGSMVREGEKQGQVTAVFDLSLDHPAWDVVRAQDIEADGTLLLRRVQMPDGRTRAFLNDSPISAQTLRDVSRQLVEIHGQHDDRALVDPAAHRTLLDAYGGLEAKLSRVREAFAARKAAERHHDEEQARIAKAQADSEYLHHVHEELSKLKPRPGEEETLGERRAVMQQSEKVSGDLRDAYDSVAGEGSPLTTFSALLRRLERRAVQAPTLIEPCLKALDGVLVALDGATSAFEEALQAADFDPRELETVEERLFALRAAARKHSVSVEELPALLDRFTADIEALDAGETRLAGLAQAVEAARDTYRRGAEDLSKARVATATKLDTAVNRELAPLKLERARFSTEIASDPVGSGSEGIDRVEFWVSTNPGTRPGTIDQGGIRRRTRALHAGPESLSGRSWLRADACLRRDRHRRRGCRGGRDRIAPCPAVGQGPGSRRDPRSSGGGALRLPSADLQEHPQGGEPRCHSGHPAGGGVAPRGDCQDAGGRHHHGRSPCRGAAPHRSRELTVR